MIGSIVLHGFFMGFGFPFDHILNIYIDLLFVIVPI